MANSSRSTSWWSCFDNSFLFNFCLFFYLGEPGNIIVGIDSGTTRAFAVVDHNGRAVVVKSKKNWKTSELIQEISTYCTPSMVACDTNPTSRAVRELNTCFGSKLFAPHSSLSVFEKHKLAEKTGAVFSNSHERDALAAARKAFNCHSNKLRQAATRAAKLSYIEPALACKLVLVGARLAEL